MDDIIKELKKVKQDKELFRKELYKFYEKNYFNTKFLEEISSKLGTSVYEINENINTYARNELDMLSNIFYEYKRKIRKEHNFINLTVENPILKEIGISTFLLWNNEKEREYFLKYLYTFLFNDFSETKIKTLQKMLNMSDYKYSMLIDEILSYNNMSKEEYDKLVKDDRNKKIEERKREIRQNNTEKINVYKSILRVEDYRDVASVFGEYTLSAIINDFKFYEEFFTSEEVEKINEKLKGYRYWKIHEKGKKDRYDKRTENINCKIIEIFTKYLDSNYCFFEIKERNKLSDILFEKYFLKLENIDVKLHKKVINKKTMDEFNIKNSIQILNDQFTNGIIDNGKLRDFDLIDYFLITKIPMRVIFKKIELNKDTIKLKTFLKKYLNSDEESLRDEKYILEERRIVNLERDNDEKIIEGTGREITLEEKQNIILFIKSNNVPFNRTTFNIALKRYLNGYLTFNNGKKLDISLNNNS